MQGQKERQLLVLLATGILIVITITVLLLIAVWNRKTDLDNEQKEYKLGRLNINESVGYEDYVKKYYSKIEQMLIEKNYEKLYNYLGEDYVEYSGYTLESFKEYLQNKKIIGQLLELKSYENLRVQGYSNVYIMNIKLKEGIYDINVVVRERSPNDFSIALEEYVKSETSAYDTTMNGINLKIKQIIYFSNYIEYKVVIKNVHDDDIILNANSAIENMYLKLTNNELNLPYNTVLGGRQVTIEKDRIKEYSIKFNIPNANINAMSSLVIKDIYYKGRDMTSDVEFVFK